MPTAQHPSRRLTAAALALATLPARGDPSLPALRVAEQPERTAYAGAGGAAVFAAVLLASLLVAALLRRRRRRPPRSLDRVLLAGTVKSAKEP